MEWLRRERNPWGQEFILGLSWDLIWVALAAGALFILLHLVLYYWRWREPDTAGPGVPKALADQLPQRVLRHTIASRMFHWVMALSALALLLTGFLPILGVKFSWVTIHWISGAVLTLSVLFHVFHASLWKGLRLMWISREDLRDGWLTLQQVVGANAPLPGKPGKNPLENKIFHHAVALAMLATIFSGLIMMAKVDTPWWDRNPYLVSDDTWGWIYILHGAGSVGLITLVMAHFYFAARPEKLWITLSMFRGWIPKSDYLEHYDPARWSGDSAPDPRRR